MQEDIENKSVTLIINTSKLTARTLATAFMKFLGYSKGKLKEHHEVKPKGKQSVKELIAQNQGVEKTELADKEEAKTFDHIAKQYGVDYAIQKGVSPEGKQRYMLFFKARDRSAIDQAMSAYAASYMKKHKRDHPPIQPVVDPAKDMLPGRKKDRVLDKGMQR
ncbi:MAG: PcfB family protein [Clostridia bacterium]|nr:PcfB family protein [Clostridia bacterium]